ncbi:hypothetical protein EDC94DRAFT_615802 [Helicostylum pulchrum]|nr:hypothetical protein EDC94DRAFT_615802 [Helicostylum pulchrum]
MFFSKGYKDHTTRPYKRCMKEPYKNILTIKVIAAYKDIRQIVFRAKIFDNYHILQHQDRPVPPGIRKQQFWYTICQLVNGRRPTSNMLLLPKSSLYLGSIQK